MRGADLSPPPPGKQKFLATPIRQLKLRVLPSGVMSWVIPEPRSFTIGRLENWPWPIVEPEAHRLLRLINQGVNLQTERNAQRGRDGVPPWRPLPVAGAAVPPAAEHYSSTQL